MTKENKTVDTKTSGEPTLEQKQTMLKTQINNIDIVGRILVEEGAIIEQFIKSKQIIGREDQESFKRKLENVAVALGVAAQYFEGKVTGLENELKSITKK
tara:strand:- start:908 stop:1207 length:300 start_codon:yes stop_codon:yes gene_type:complete